MKHSKMIQAGAALAVATLALAGCAGATGGDDSTETLRLGAVTELSTFEPWNAAWANQSTYLQPVYDTLLRAEPDGTIVAGLATGWEWNESRTELTLELREGIEFSDGEVFDAEVAVGNLERFRDGTSQNASYLSSVTGIEATDGSTVVLTLAAPDPSLLVYLSQNAGLQGSPTMWDAPDAQTSPIGSGPYTLVEDQTVVGSTYVYEVREDYWDAENVHYDEVIVNFYSDPTALMNAVNGGQVDATNSQASTQGADAEAAGYTVHANERNWTGFLLVDRDGALNPAMGDARVRQAFNHALDREGLLQALDGGFGTPTTQVFGTYTEAYDAELDKRYPYDPERARELLAEAGYPDGIDLVMPSSDFVPQSTYVLYGEMLAESGINVTWEEGGDDLFGRMLGGSWSAFSFLLGMDPTTWQTVQFSMLPDSTWNPFRVDDPQVVAFAERIRHGGEDGDLAGRELNEYIVEQAWFAPTYRVEGAFFTAPGTEAVLQDDNAVPYLWNIRPTS